MKKLITYNLQLTTSERGVASLGAMLLFGAVIVEIALVTALLSYLLGTANLGGRLAAEALAAARAGVDDALIKIIRGTDSTGGTYPLTVGSATADIRICKDVIGGTSSGCGTTSATGKREIIALGKTLARRRLMVAVVEVDLTTRLMKIESLIEKPL